MGWIIFLGWALLTFMALFHNYRGNDVFMLSINLNKLNSPMFELGISNRHWHDSNGRCIETYTLGLFFIKIEVDFFQVADSEDE